MTAADMFEKRKKEKRKELTRQMKPLRIGWWKKTGWCGCVQLLWLHVSL
jgi:hypothetical protein